MLKVENNRKLKYLRENGKFWQKAGIKTPAFFFDRLYKTEWMTVM